MSETRTAQANPVEETRSRVSNSLEEASRSLKELMGAGRELGTVSLSLLREGLAERRQAPEAEHAPEPPLTDAPPETAPPEESPDVTPDRLNATAGNLADILDKAADFLDCLFFGEDCQTRRGKWLYFEIKDEEKGEAKVSPPVSLDKALHVMLTEITAAYGLRYNRAALFFLEFDQWCLIGRMAIGHLEREEALDDWIQDQEKGRDKFDRYLALLDENALPRTPLELRIRGLRLPLGEPDADLFARVILSESWLLADPNDFDRLPAVFRSVFAPTTPLIIIPIRLQERVIGLLVADNKFTGNLITPTDIEILLTYLETELIAINEHTLYAAITEPPYPPPVEEPPEFEHSDLIRIVGIGDEYERRLFNAGIFSQAELLSAAETRQGRLETAERAKISYPLILTWANHIDLCRVPGIDEEMAYLLELAGVDTVPELAQRNPHNLQQTLLETIASQGRKFQPSVAEVQGWIVTAGGLPRMLYY